ncbi:alpha/beta fold hydrolase [Dactylosporangium sp. CS-047395]|uniref:alpha/beta fold hydrolase n=1 Tax=Dactylosporangium sp. CS-047395 TaxID=3239936 RepID=UPI003D938131
MLLLLLHGLGGTGSVWDGWGPLLADRWPGRVVAPDLPGHGRAGELAEYTFEAIADHVLPLVEEPARTVVLGHSLGGVVGLALAARTPLKAVVGLGIKVAWTQEELDRSQALAQRPVQWFDTREEAVARHLKVAGLAGIVGADEPAALDGVREEDGRWRLNLDPRAFAVGAPDMDQLLRRANTAVTLARGGADPMNTDEQLTRFGVDVVSIDGLGHNAHVESPERCVALLERYS